MTNVASGPQAASSPIPSVALPQIVFLEDDEEDAPVRADPGTVVLTCANCGAMMDERKCKLICRCGYFLSCSDYY
jgi:hypothetical protein